MKQDGALFEIARRTFDTPEFRGITFIEAEAKSIINHVLGNAMPFSWTINPYRGCSHACVYCLAGDTPVLMADGSARPISDLRPGDEIYGTERRGNYRRYVKTRVLAQWQTMKLAYRIRLEDGTQLIASADHRFLSNRGWKHVTGAEHGPLQRPHLTLSNKLMGVGRFADGPKVDDDYKRGYLCGVIRGDGHLGSYVYARPKRGPSTVHRFRLALKDPEALERTRDYLAFFGVSTNEFIFAKAKLPNRAEMRAIRTSSERNVVAIRDLIAWPESPTKSWRKGFLAGIFDAEGGFSGSLRIANTDPAIVGAVAESLDALSFLYVIEHSGPRPMTYVRLRGGLRSIIRFFHTVDPAITRKRSIEGIAIKGDAPLHIQAIEPLGIEVPMFDITTGTGDFIANGVISHNCFARVTHTYMDMNAGKDFETKIVVKINAPDVLRAQLRSRRWHGDHIAMGTATDPYQRAEGRYRLMEGIIAALTDYRNPFSILTKGTLILRDLDLLKEAAKVTEVSTAFSIGTLDEDAWRASEPGTPNPRKRIEAVAALNDAGIPCGVLVAPILPGITDDPKKIKEVVRAAIDARATHVSPILLHLRPTVREEYMSWLAENYPDLVPRYEAMYARSPYGPKEQRNALGRTVGRIISAAGGIKPRAHIAARFSREHKEQKKTRQPKQLKLI